MHPDLLKLQFCQFKEPVTPKEAAKHIVGHCSGTQLTDAIERAIVTALMWRDGNGRD
jgi:hypothetical protein